MIPSTDGAYATSALKKILLGFCSLTYAWHAPDHEVCPSGGLKLQVSNAWALAGRDEMRRHSWNDYF